MPATLRGQTAIAQATIDGVRRHLDASRALFGAHTRYELWGLRGGYTLVERGRFDAARGRVGAARPRERAAERRGERAADASGAVRGEVRVRRFVATR